MADYDNGLPPVTKSEGEISSTSIDKIAVSSDVSRFEIEQVGIEKQEIQASDSKEITSISIDKASINYGGFL